MATLPRRATSACGNELVELAIVLPILLLTMAAIIDFAFVLQRYEVVTNAAREGARLGTLPGYAQTDIQTRVADYVAAAGLKGSATTTVQAYSIPVGAGTPQSGVRVTVTYPHAFLVIGPIGQLFGGSYQQVTLTGVSTMRLEVQP